MLARLPRPVLHVILVVLETIFALIRKKGVYPFPYNKTTNTITVPAQIDNELYSLVAVGKHVEARLKQDSPTPQRPPSTDSPYTKARKPSGDAPPRKAGGQPGHPGHRQALLAPTETRILTPPQCACGHTAWTVTRPYHTHQVLELPAIQMEVTHWVLQEAWCPMCAQWTKAPVPPEHTAGYGPRLTALVGEIAGTNGTGS